MQILFLAYEILPLRSLLVPCATIFPSSHTKRRQADKGAVQRHSRHGRSEVLDCTGERRQTAASARTRCATGAMARGHLATVSGRGAAPTESVPPLRRPSPPAAPEPCRRAPGEAALLAAWASCSRGLGRAQLKVQLGLQKAGAWQSPGRAFRLERTLPKPRVGPRVFCINRYYHSLVRVGFFVAGCREARSNHSRSMKLHSLM